MSDTTRAQRNRWLAEKLADGKDNAPIEHPGLYRFPGVPIYIFRGVRLSEAELAFDRDPAQMMMVLETMAKRSLAEWTVFLGSIMLSGRVLEPGSLSLGIDIRSLLQAGQLPEAVCRAAALATGFREEAASGKAE